MNTDAYVVDCGDAGKPCDGIWWGVDTLERCLNAMHYGMQHRPNMDFKLSRSVHIGGGVVEFHPAGSPFDVERAKTYAREVVKPCREKELKWEKRYRELLAKGEWFEAWATDTTSGQRLRFLSDDGSKATAERHAAMMRVDHPDRLVTVQAVTPEDTMT